MNQNESKSDVEVMQQEIQRLSALVRAQQIAIEKLEATLFDLSYCDDAENLYDLAVKADNGGQP